MGIRSIKYRSAKHFGWTDGVHSRFEDLTPAEKKGKTYPIKGIDFIKYGGNYDPRNKKELMEDTLNKLHKKEIKESL